MDLSDLNSAQRDAVTAGDGPVLVVAGAGTGKTRTLVHRVAWLIEHGVPPRGIVLLTFTRRAAHEMLSRAARSVGPQASSVRGGTFHGFANTALRRHAEVLGYSRNFTILDRPDAEALVGLVRDELGLGGKTRRFPRRGTVLKILSRAINTCRDIEDIVLDSYPQFANDVDDIRALAARYAVRKREQHVMDYDDLLVHLDRLLVEHADVRKTLATACQHVLVDEYQDTNKLQARIACLLASVHGNLMVVGDEAQSIYAFRGADVRNILDFPKIFPDARTILLEENYRSTQPVLDLANGILDSASHGYDKRLTATQPGGGKPVLVDVLDEHEQAEFVVRQVLHNRETGTDLRQTAVLFRSASHANLLEIALSQANIPFRKFGGMKFVEAAHIKDCFALLRLVANPRDVLAWLRVLPWSEGLGTTGARKIAATVLAAEPPRLDPTPYAKRRYAPDLLSLAALLDACAPDAQDVGLVVERVLAWYRDRMPALYDDARRREKDLDTLPLLAAGYRDLETFLTEVALDPPQAADANAADHDDEWLTLSTIHSAKGLEWRSVFVLQIGDGHFPSGFSLEDPEALEEERRLFYVAVTRAKRLLYLIQPQLLRVRWGPVSAPGCALLDDMPSLPRLVDEGRFFPEPPQEAVAAIDAEAADDRARRVLDWFGE